MTVFGHSKRLLVWLDLLFSQVFVLSNQCRFFAIRLCGSFQSRRRSRCYLSWHYILVFNFVGGLFLLLINLKRVTIDLWVRAPVLKFKSIMRLPALFIVFNLVKLFLLEIWTSASKILWLVTEVLFLLHLDFCVCNSHFVSGLRDVLLWTLLGLWCFSMFSLWGCLWLSLLL